MNNFEIYNIVNYLINKSQAGNAFSPPEFERLLNHVSLSLFKDRLGNPKKEGYSSITRSLVDLKDFVVIKDGNSRLVFNNGKAVIPTDMAYPIGMTYNETVKVDCEYEINPINVELLDEGEYQLRKSSLLKPITKEYPVVKIDDYFYIYPNDIRNTDFTYFKYPIDVVFATTTNATTGELEYDAANSTELEWNDLAKLDIITLMLSSVGLNLRSQDIAQYAQAVKVQGV